ncbi:MAG: GGDEF domain-containing protein [Pseudomonadota bacterium]
MSHEQSSANRSVSDDDVASRAIAFAQKNDTPLTPYIYEVWYTYAARSSEAVNEAIDLALNTGEPIHTDMLTELYQTHISPSSMTDQIADIGNTLQRTLGNVTEAMDENLRDQSVFSGALRNVKQNLVVGSSKREVTDVIKQLHRANQEQIQSTQRVTIQLEKNRAQVAKLKGELIEAKRTANTDYLTGLPNRRMMDEHLDSAIFEARLRKQTLCLLLAQLDNLDAVSRAHGITVADSILKTFAEQMDKELPGREVASRFAGAKFAILIPDADGQSGFMAAERIRKRLRMVDFVARETGAKIGTMSVSFGGTTLTEGDGRTDLIERSDKALLQAQRDGQDRTVIQ